MKTSDFKISICPTCGSDVIHSVCEDWSGVHQGETYTVKTLEYYSCPSCGEKVYSPEAMRRIQQASPAFRSRRRNVRRVAKRPTAQPRP